MRGADQIYQTDGDFCSEFVGVLAVFSTWAEVWAAIESHRIRDPVAITLVPLSEIQDICDPLPTRPPSGESVAALRMELRIDGAQQPDVSPPMLTIRGNNASLPEALLPQSAAASAFGVELGDSKRDAGMPPEFDILLPAARIASLQMVALTRKSCCASSLRGAYRASSDMYDPR